MNDYSSVVNPPSAEDGTRARRRRLVRPNLWITVPQAVVTTVRACVRAPTATPMDATKRATYGTLPSGKESATSVFPVRVQAAGSSSPLPGAAEQPKTNSKETEKLIWNPTDTASNASSDNSRISSCTAIFLVVNYMIGSGILNTPQTFKDSGIAATTLLYILAGALHRFTLIWLHSRARCNSAMPRVFANLHASSPNPPNGENLKFCLCGGFVQAVVISHKSNYWTRVQRALSKSFFKYRALVHAHSRIDDDAM